MVTIQRIDSMGYNLSFFKIRQAESEKGTFIYYTFDEGWRLEYMTHWNIIGVRRRNDHPYTLN